jgi:hypothetical protein
MQSSDYRLQTSVLRENLSVRWAALIGEDTRPLENLEKHSSSELPCVRVLQ